MAEWIPWWARIPIKVVLSRLPVSRRLWRWIGIFQHGDMNRGEYARRVFARHLQSPPLGVEIHNKCILELGPGDGLATALLVAAHGGTSILVDVGAFAYADVARYKALAAQLAKEGLTPPDLGGIKCMDDYLRASRSRYLTNGLESLRSIESGSVDVTFSHSVLQHVRRKEFRPLLAEMYRITKPNGVCSHWVDLHDMLGGALNNLRFSARLWELGFFSNSGFYTNRFRYSELLEMLRNTGFEVKVLQKNLWSELPTPLKKMNRRFRTFFEDDLLVSSFHVVGVKH